MRKFISQFREDALTKSAPYVNHWLCGAAGGNYGDNYRQGTSANSAGIWANNPAEMVYFPATRDADEQPLDGSNSYVMHFPADGLPDSVVNAYWSVILVCGPDYRIVANPLKRYNFQQPFAAGKGNRRLVEDRHRTEAGRRYTGIELAAAFSRGQAVLAHLPHLRAEGRTKEMRVDAAGADTSELISNSHGGRQIQHLREFTERDEIFLPGSRVA